jgi:PRC-barrel domain
MEDLGAPSSYLTVSKGVPVYSSDGEKLGRVLNVLSAPNLDMFEGIVFDAGKGPGGHRFVDAPDVGEIFEGGVVLKIDASEAASLSAPDPNPGSVSVDPADLVGGRPSFISRTWNRLSGKD